MAIARVQANALRGAAVSGLDVTFDFDVTAGNSIVAAVVYEEAIEPVTVTDSQSNSYTLDKTHTASRRADIHRSSDVAGGTTTVTFTSAEVGNADALIVEYDKNLELDQSASDSQASGTSHPCGSITTTVADEVIVTASRPTSAYSATPASGYSQLSKLPRGFFQERITTSTESTDGAWTSGDSEDVTSVICSYNEVAAAGNAMPMAMDHYRRKRVG